VRFIVEHPEVFEFRTISEVANVAVVAQQENIVAVNNILAIDLTGQAVINYLGYLPIAGIGGNFDFTVGSHYAKGGRSHLLPQQHCQGWNGLPHRAQHTP